MMKKYKILPIVLSIMLLFTPYLVGAIEENEGETTPPATSTPTTPPSETEYSISLNKNELNLNSGDTATLSAIVSPEDSKVEWSSSNEEIATVDNNGKVTAGTKEGKATITAKIKDRNETATCIVNVSVPKVKGTDATLKSLKITNGKLNKTFKSDVYEYTVTVDSDVTTLKFEYELSDGNARYFGPNNNTNLKNGDKLEIKIVAEDEETNHTYVLTISKPTSNNTISLNLKSLKINGYALNETFKATTLKYTANIPYEIDTLTIEANPEDSNANVTISGNKNLKVGQNTVTITVRDNSGKSKVYQIVVTREEEVSVEEKPTSIITSSNHTTSSAAGIMNYPDTNNPDNFLKYMIVSVACLILLAIGGIGIYFYMKTSPKKLRKELAQHPYEKEKVVESPIVEASSFPNKIFEEEVEEATMEIEKIKEMKKLEDTIDLQKTKEMKKEELLEMLFEDERDV